MIEQDRDHSIDLFFHDPYPIQLRSRSDQIGQPSLFSNIFTYDYHEFEKNDNISSFSIGYDELKYTLYSEIPKTEPFGFISEIGGTLGLFIGCSFITLFEIGELLLEIFIILCRRKNQNKFNIKIVNENRF